VLSIGTGVLTKPSGKTKSAEASKSKMLHKMIPSGIRKKITTGYDMVRSTLDCEREWEDFVSSKRHDPSLVGVCHRLNVGLEEKPPKIDDILKMGWLKIETDYYFSSKARQHYFNKDYRIGYDHIQVVARRLVASLFYFERVSASSHSSPPDQNHRRKASGFLRCRLSPTMETQFASLISSKPEFRTTEGERPPTSIPRFQFDSLTFSSPELELSVSSDSWTIEVRFPSLSRKWEAISGHS
jgi:hypothetical protein